MELLIFVYNHKSPKRLRLKAELIYKSGQIERYKISGHNRSILLQNDYPLIESTKSQKGKVHWKVIGGSITDNELLASIIREVEHRRKDFIKPSPEPSPEK